MEFAPWPSFSDDEIRAAVNVLKSGKINQWTGGEVMAFEQAFARYVGTRHAIALANGSLALDMVLAALDIGPGDEVVVTPRSFVASAACVALRGATPVFVDVNPESQNITPESISGGVTERTKAVIAVNLAGWPCDLKNISSFCRQNKIFLIEDCAQAHGAEFQGKKAGSFGDCAVFSFCQDKIMTTGGEGGMLVTDNTELWKKVWSFKDHGKDYDQTFSKNHGPGFRWLVNSFGTNGRMTEMQAAMGRVMLGKLDNWVEKRRAHADMLTRGFENTMGLRVTVPPPKVYHSYYKYYVFVNQDQLQAPWNRDRIIDHLNMAGVPCQTGSCPEIYRERAFENRPCRLAGAMTDHTGKAFLPVARHLGDTSIMFMVHPTLSPAAVQYVVDQVNQIMKQAVR
ncbi:MAG: DegT/DnrJ/EryC1/StrS aminotransferase family protein [Desulfotignum sp.]|nr:DegT/DnrJ/EryC1/StrS aminotransferase family protein [Desulfotignum sp.]